jgi:cytochrome P450
MAVTKDVINRARQEIDIADKAGRLSTPIQYEETRQHLPFFVGCIKEGLRLNPPATNLFARVAPKGGKVIDGHFVPEGTEITSHAYAMQRDKGLYGDDSESFKPERWLESEKKNFEFEAAQFTFGVGPRVCLGKDVAIMELYKLLPEVSVSRIGIGGTQDEADCAKDCSTFRHSGRETWEICCCRWCCL